MVTQNRHLTDCDVAFQIHVGDHFPRAAERFKRNFPETYAFIRAMPLLDPSEKRFTPRVDRGKQPTAVQPTELEIEVALTAIGIKSLSVVKSSKLRSFLEHEGKTLLEQAALGTHVYSNNLLVYEPVLASEILSRKLNSKITPEEVSKALVELYLLGEPELDDELTSALFGFIEPLRTIQTEDPINPSSLISPPFSFSLFSHNNTHSSAPMYRTTPFNCPIYDSANSVNLEGWAAAAALIEEIKESPLSVVSVALLSDERIKLVAKQVLITRDKIAGDWDVKESSDWNV